MLTSTNSNGINNWRTEDSILNFLYSYLDDEGNLNKSTSKFKENEKKFINAKFAPGMIDALFSTTKPSDSEKYIDKLVKYLKSIALNGDTVSEQKFFQIVSTKLIDFNIIDYTFELANIDSLPKEPHLTNFAKDLISKTADISSVKFGMQILAKCQDKSVLKDIKVLGLHDEFTFYATNTIIDLSNHVENDLWELGKRIDGWGRIKLIEKLAKFKLSEPIKDWFFYEGYKNKIYYEYSALDCAIQGELYKKIRVRKISYRVYRSASDIICALVNYSVPGGKIDNLPYPSKIIQNFIRHAKFHAKSISDFRALDMIEDYLKDIKTYNVNGKIKGWDNKMVEIFLTEINEIYINKNG